MGNEITTMESASRPPSELIQNADPDIRKYILEIESKLQNCIELDTKYLDIQEDLFGMQVQNHEYKNQTTELTKENNKLRLENDELRKENQQLKQQAEQHKNKETFNSVNTNPPSETRILKERTISTDSAKQNKYTPDDTNYANSILVKNFPKDLFESDDFQKSIILLGRHMHLKLTELDIRGATIKERKFYERQNMQPDNIIMIVEFSNQDLKVDFLKHKEKLKKDESTKDIEITDFVSETTYNLYQYAKVLKSHGYNSVYWRNNCVYAKKTRSTNSQPILIESQSQVDVLKSLK